MVDHYYLMPKLKGSSIAVSIIKNSGILFSGNALASLLSLASFALTARALGPENFGTLILLQTFILTIQSLVSFNAWQAFIKYGADCIGSEDKNELRKLVKLLVTVELSAAFIGLFVCVGLLQPIGGVLQWSPQTIELAAIYSIVIVFSATGTAIGVLRLFNRFMLFSAHAVASALIKLVLIAPASLLNADLSSFVYINIFASLCSSYLLIYLARKELNKQGHGNILKAELDITGRSHPGIWRFLAFTNLNGSVRSASRNFDILIIGAILDSTSVGLYKISKQLTGIALQITSPLYETTYPELAKLWATKQTVEFIKIVIKIGLLAGGGR